MSHKIWKASQDLVGHLIRTILRAVPSTLPSLVIKFCCVSKQTFDLILPTTLSNIYIILLIESISLIVWMGGRPRTAVFVLGGLDQATWLRRLPVGLMTWNVRNSDIDIFSVWLIVIYWNFCVCSTFLGHNLWPWPHHQNDRTKTEDLLIYKPNTIWIFRPKNYWSRQYDKYNNFRIRKNRCWWDQDLNFYRT